MPTSGAALPPVELVDLRRLAVRSLIDASLALRETKLTNRLRRHGGTPVEAERLAAYFAELARTVEAAVPLDASATTNVAMWFDFAGIDPHQEDELTRSAHEGARNYNAYVRRMSQA